MTTSDSTKKNTHISNYDKWCEEWRLRFLAMDQKRLMTLLPELTPEGDDEFPAQANLLFDASATDYIHGESIVTIATVGVARLIEEAGLEPDKSMF